MHYVYILKSLVKGKQIYVGSTCDLRRRLQEHNEGVEVSTKRYMPWTLVYYEAYGAEGLARTREQRLKHSGNALRELKRRAGLDAVVKSGAGFTLVEIVVAMGVFVVAISLGVGVFISGIKAQRRLTAQMAVNNDVNLVLEQIARDIRTGYLFSVVEGGSELHFTNRAGNRTVYQLEDMGAAVLRYVAVSGGSIPLTGERVTSQNAEVVGLDFQLHPRDEFSPTAGVNISCDPWRITIAMEVRPVRSNESPIVVQTTVSSRVLPQDIDDDGNDDNEDDYKKCEPGA
jgi:putative endonuclease